MTRPAASLLDRFLAHLQFERGLAANTILSYRRELEKFFAYLARLRRDCLHLDEKEILAFINNQRIKLLQSLPATCSLNSTSKRQS